jgi:hypothetical protein
MMMAVCATVAVAGGCGIAPDAVEASSTDEVRVSPQGERATTLLPLRSDDLVDISAMQATFNAACPASTTCIGFNSCASWSSITSCGQRECGGGCDVCNPKLLTCVTGIERSTFTTRFRVCFNAQQQSCTEFQVFTATTCQTSTLGDCCKLVPGTCGQTDL